MEMSVFNNRHDVIPRRQVGTVPSHHGQSKATSTSDTRYEAGMWQSRATRYNIGMIHWNAEGVRTTSSSEGKTYKCLLYTGDASKLKSPLLYQELRDF